MRNHTRVCAVVSQDKEGGKWGTVRAELDDGNYVSLTWNNWYRNKNSKHVS